MALERTIYLYHSLALYINLIKHDESFPTEAVLNSWKDERGDLIVFNKLIKTINVIFRQADGLSDSLNLITFVSENNNFFIVGE
jgi:hypothetical protein